MKLTLERCYIPTLQSRSVKIFNMFSRLNNINLISVKEGCLSQSLIMVHTHPRAFDRKETCQFI